MRAPLLHLRSSTAPGIFRGLRVVCSVLLFALSFFLSSPSLADPAVEQQRLLEALRWLQAPPNSFTQYDYFMTARVRLIFFWAGKDDVGGGYIRRGISADDSHKEFFQVLFGSDPEKAPRAINRWGAGTEVDWHKNPVGFRAQQEDVSTSAFFGFMKSSRGKSVSEMQAELKKENEKGEHSFTGILSRVEPDQAHSLIVPLQSETDYNLHQYDQAEPIMLAKIQSTDRPMKTLQGAADQCSRTTSFLGTVAQMMDLALQGSQAQPLCYIHDAQENTLTLETVTKVPTLPVQLHGPNNTVLLDTTYTDLLQLDFVSTHRITGKKVYFTIYEGTRGADRGVPVQIRYQPNWWFEVVLNLRNAKTGTLASATAAALSGVPS